MTLQILFWAAVGLIAYTYIGYPILLAVWTKLFAGSQRQAADSAKTVPEDWPFVSLIIAAYKEESVILQRLNNALLMDYPADRFEVIIGCDGNEDSTGELVRSVNDPRVRLLQFPQRRGKPSVLNDCVNESRGEIIAFSDANTFWNADALKRLISHFSEERIGGVCGQLQLTDPRTGENVDGLYWRYENFLKKCEGKLGALLGFNGAIYAIRRELWEPIPPQSIVDDFLIGMRIHLHGDQLVFDDQAIAHEESAPTMAAEFHRRARIGAGGFQSLVWLAKLLNPFRGRVALAFWSHKVLRWFCPLFLLTAFVTNACLLSVPLYQGLFAAQCLFYGMALVGRYLPGQGIGVRVVRLVSMFMSMNLALSVGFWRWFSNRQSGAWKRTARSEESSSSEARVKVPQA